ncbi:MAG: LamG-like jellyroll fold domain-containing protein [bacterium]
MSSPKGFGLIQALLAVALVSGAIFVFATLFNILRLNKTGSLYTAAYKIAQEQIETIQTLPLSSLTNRTSADFLNVIYNKGAAGVISDATAPSAPNTLQLSSSTTTLNLALLPFGGIADFTFEASVKTTGAPQKTGLLFRAQDTNNYYFFYIKSDRIVLEKKASGSASTLYETFQTFNVNTWYKLKVIASGSTISLYLNDTKIQDVVDSSFTSGSYALADLDTPSNFDDVLFSYGGETSQWNFDNLSAGEIPSDWRRLGLADLPDGRGVITISEPYGTTDIKKIDVSVSWIEKGQTKSVTISTLKTQ